MGKLPDSPTQVRALITLPAGFHSLFTCCLPTSFSISSMKCRTKGTPCYLESIRCWQDWKCFASICIKQFLNEWMSEWVSEWVGGWVGEWVGGWVGGWVSEWVGGWVSEWVSEWVYLCPSFILSILSAVQYVYHLSFPKFCDGPHGVAQYSCHVLWQLWYWVCHPLIVPCMYGFQWRFYKKKGVNDFISSAGCCLITIVM